VGRAGANRLMARGGGGNGNRRYMAVAPACPSPSMSQYFPT